MIVRTSAFVLAGLCVVSACEGREVDSGTAALAHPSFAGLASESQDAVAAAEVRALLFPPRLAGAAVAMSGEQWLALSARQGELTLSLHQTSRAHHHLEDVAPGEQIPAPRFFVRDSPARSGLNEGIRFVTWVDQQTAYSLEVECERVLDDSRCAEPDFALNLADELVAF